MAFYGLPENVQQGKLGPLLQAPPLPFACSPHAAFKKNNWHPAMQANNSLTVLPQKRSLSQLLA